MTTWSTRTLAAVALGVSAGLAPHAAVAAPPAASSPDATSRHWPKADAALGRKLIAQHRCNACHAERLGGDGLAIYRPQGRIDQPAKLRGMVGTCATRLDLNLFDDELDAIAAALDRDHYHFR